MKKDSFFILLLILIILLISGCKKSFCGNSECEKDESSANCCIDCSCPSGYSCDNNACKKIEECGNGICGEGETSLNCCQDCGCDTGFNCLNGKCKSTCGDGIKASDETSGNCCLDAGCSSGEICENNMCIELKPQIEITSFNGPLSWAVTYLRAVGDNFNICLENNGNDIAKSIIVSVSSPNNYFGDNSKNIGSINKGDSKCFDIEIDFLESVLDIVSETSLHTDIKVKYQNSMNKNYEMFLVASVVMRNIEFTEPE